MRSLFASVAPFCVDDNHRPVNLRQRSISEERRYGLDAGGQQHVVRIEKDQDVASARGVTRVEGGALTGIRLQKRSNEISVTFYHTARVVGRAVVDNDHLMGRESLVQGTVDAFAQKLRVVVVVYENADRRHRAHEGDTATNRPSTVFFRSFSRTFSAANTSSAN